MQNIDDAVLVTMLKCLAFVLFYMFHLLVFLKYARMVTEFPACCRRGRMEVIKIHLFIPLYSLYMYTTVMYITLQFLTPQILFELCLSYNADNRQCLHLLNLDSNRLVFVTESQCYV